MNMSSKNCARIKNRFFKHFKIKKEKIFTFCELFFIQKVFKNWATFKNKKFLSLILTKLEEYDKELLRINLALFLPLTLLLMDDRNVLKI